MKSFEIWIGNYHLGQGYDGPTCPQLLATETASGFEIACLKYELRRKLSFIEKAEAEGAYISHQDREWCYDWKRNANSWTGKYYSSKEEALQSF
jgi:hypothetical protein